MKTQYKQEEGFPSGFFPFLLDFRCLVTSIFSLSLSCFGSAVDLEKVLEFIATIYLNLIHTGGSPLTQLLSPNKDRNPLYCTIQVKTQLVPLSSGLPLFGYINFQSHSLSCFGSAVDLEKVLEVIANI